MDMNADRWAFTSKYLSDVFGREPPAFARIRENAVAAGLPPIAISADVGRLLTLLASTTRGLRGLEIGTLGGYSAAWIAKGMRPGSQLLSLELETAHAEVARKSLTEAGMDNVEVRVADARLELSKLAFAKESLDVVFIDADKESYVAYFDAVKDWIAPGGLLMADNVMGARAWWIDMIEHPARRAVDEFNRRVVADERFEVIAVPIREGVLVARRKDA
ncbi:MAG: O-methyltransferase [Deltaproteobacteria bacterium]|nr:O-methyltransferase [Deltaproteobacteria bacterium]